MDKTGFSATGGVVLLGSLQDNQGLSSWAYKGMDLNTFSIKANLKAFTMSGNLSIMQDHPTYGNAFRSKLEVEIKSFLQGATIQASAVFGRKDFRYWYFDAMVDNLPIQGNIINPKGFAGGAYYKMQKTGFASEGAGVASNFGNAFAYEPNNSSGLGFKPCLSFLWAQNL